MAADCGYGGAGDVGLPPPHAPPSMGPVDVAVQKGPDEGLGIQT
eukprot:gene9777-34040_t